MKVLLLLGLGNAASAGWGDVTEWQSNVRGPWDRWQQLAVGPSQECTWWAQSPSFDVQIVKSNLGSAKDTALHLEVPSKTPLPVTGCKEYAWALCLTFSLQDIEQDDSV